MWNKHPGRFRSMHDAAAAEALAARQQPSGPTPSREAVILGRVGRTAITVAFVWFAALAAWWNEPHQALRDTHPGLRVISDAYSPPPGCPVRSWSVGEYLPEACFVRIEHNLLEPLGLEVRPRRKSVAQQWVRLGNDAAAVATFGGDIGQIRTIVRRRFYAPTPAVRSEVQAADFRKPPPGFGQRTLLVLLGAPFAGLLLSLLYWLPKLPPKISPAPSDEAHP